MTLTAAVSLAPGADLGAAAGAVVRRPERMDALCQAGVALDPPVGALRRVPGPSSVRGGERGTRSGLVFRARSGTCAMDSAQTLSLTL